MDEERSHAALTVRLEGPGVREGRVSLRVLSKVAECIQRAIVRVLQAQEGTRQTRGRIPEQLLREASLDLSAIGSGSAVLVFAPSMEAFGPEYSRATKACEVVVSGLAAARLPASDRAALPSWFTPPVVSALAALQDVYDVDGVDRLSFASLDGTAVEAADINMSDWPLIQRFEVVGEEDRQSSVVGRLLMADLKNSRCRVYQPHGRSLLVTFPPGDADAIKAALKGWVEVSQPGGDDELAFVRPISDDEADELAPARQRPWPASVLAAIRAAGDDAHAELAALPEYSNHELDD